MTKKELIEAMKKVNQQYRYADNDTTHGKIDDLLLSYIDDEEVTAEYVRNLKWYS